MSNKDREKWDLRYTEGAYAQRGHPSTFLVEWLSQQNLLSCPGAALDIACGRGRNSHYLAAQGFSVDALDISAVGLRLAQVSNNQCTSLINWQQQDLIEHPCIPRDNYQLIIMFRFVAPQLLVTLADFLAPDGYLVVEEHMRWHETVAGPGSDKFRVAPGELASALMDQGLIFHQEGLFEDPDGVAVALSRIVVQKQC
ncbi:MAG: methyltransferase domain-containing protein [Gammaproteobacteria bacterium]|nr:methyltransferase domain-containing protein [Gammaproteobacteria bacterium]